VWREGRGAINALGVQVSSRSGEVERSLGTLTSGNDPDSGGGRPSALYLATNIDGAGGVESTWDGAGWVEVQYGVSGNVSSFTVHGQCHDVSAGSCIDDTTDPIATRVTSLRTSCTCAEEQHYSFRWDELNRLVDGRRYDRNSTTSGAWVHGARLRYRYDAANQRTVKEVLTGPTTGRRRPLFGGGGGWTTSERVTLFVYPGDFERRGLTRTSGSYQPITTGTDATETQYLVAGARIVWDSEADGLLPPIDRNRRATINVTDLLGTTGAVVDLLSGDLVEVSTYYPNGARENLWTNDALVPIEPMGFTTKEADEEIGLTYFGERWLIPRLGRWATPDPLHVHAAGGGETGNSYHYVSGNLLQAVDPFGLDAIAVNTAPAGVREGESFVVRDDLPHGRSDFRDEQSFQDFARGAQVFVYDRSAPHSLAEVQEFLRTMASLPGATGAGGTQSGPGGDGPTPGDLPHFGTGRAETGSGLGTGEDSGECTGPICSTLPGGGGSTQAESGLDLNRIAVASIHRR
jgi:RHS repeat-associated protein